jgi:carbamoyltransferase
MSKYLLAVHRGHNASCAVMKDGKIVMACEEERFSRVKNDIGYPFHSLSYVAHTLSLSNDNVDRIAYTTKGFPSIFTKSRHRVTFTNADYIRHYQMNRGSFGEMSDVRFEYYRWLRDNSRFNARNNFFNFSWLTDEVLKDVDLDKQLFQREQVRMLSEHLHVNPDKIEFLDHHTCHAYYAYYSSPFRQQDCLVVTMDGGGDGRNMTAWKVVNDVLIPISDSKENVLCEIYKLVTLLLGMRPDQDEYKVMGLAAYAKDAHTKDLLVQFHEILKVDGSKIVYRNKPANLFDHLAEIVKYQRFDNIAGAVQQFTEELLATFIMALCAETGISHLVISGGIALNVKANKVINELPCITNLFVSPGPGDESLSLGGCYCLNAGGDPLENAFLGFDITQECFNEASLLVKYNVKHQVTNKEVAMLLSKGVIIARVFGKAEFGPRALGHRSILAHPRYLSSVKVINKAIKNRDFWMPFSLSVLDRGAQDYILMPDVTLAPFMTVAFMTKATLRNDIAAGIHTYDSTVRPQVVTRQAVPDYYDLIELFASITGIPALLNTSFNLHGEPMVNNLADALYTLDNSSLTYLVYQDMLITKKDGGMK